MRIGIDCTCWANQRGYGRYTRELVTAMLSLAPEHEFVCFLDDRSADVFAVDSPNVRREVVRQSVSPTLAASSGSRRSLGDMFRLTLAVRRANLDVFLSPSVYGYFPLPIGLPAVVVVHDAIPEKFPTLTLPSMQDRIFWRMKVRLALSQARLVLTVSDHAAADIVTYLGVAPERLRVTLEGVSEAYRPSQSQAAVQRAAKQAGIPEGARWLMSVGGFNPHKRLDLLVRAHAAVAKRRPSPPVMLLLVGALDDGFHKDVDGLRSLIRECGTEPLVRWPGYLSDEQLRQLHSGAVALALVSETEGFGLPAVEAARCGAPVIATTSSPLPDVLAGGGVFVPPGDLAALEAALDRLLADEEGRRAMGAHALERASALSWPRSAQVALDALVEAGSRNGR